MNNKQLTTHEILDEIEKETFKELELEKIALEENFSEIAGKRKGIMKAIYYAMFKKLLKGLKIRIIAEWNGKQIFNFEIPKD